MLKADGLDAALIGIASPAGRQEVLVYDYDKCVDIFKRNNDWSHDEAVEWMEFNVVSAYVGESTPIFVHVDDDLNPIISVANNL